MKRIFFAGLMLLLFAPTGPAGAEDVDPEKLIADTQAMAKAIREREEPLPLDPTYNVSITNRLGTLRDALAPEQKRAAVEAIRTISRAIIDDIEKRVDPAFGIAANARFRSPDDVGNGKLYDYYARCQMLLGFFLQVLGDVGDKEDIPLVETIGKAPAHLAQNINVYHPDVMAPDAAEAIRRTADALALPDRARRIDALRELALSTNTMASRRAEYELGAFGEEVADFLIAQRAERALIRMGPPAFPALMKLLLSGDPLRTSMPARIFAAHRYEPALDVMIDQFLERSADSKHFPHTGDPLVQYGREAGKRLLLKLEAQKEPDPPTLNWSARLFELTRTWEAIPFLEEAWAQGRVRGGNLLSSLETLKADRLFESLPKDDVIAAMLALEKAHAGRSPLTDRTALDAFRRLSGDVVKLARTGTPEQKKQLVRAIHSFAETLVDDAKKKVDPQLGIAPDAKFDYFTKEYPLEVPRFYAAWQEALNACMDALEMIRTPDVLAPFSIIADAPRHLRSGRDGMFEFHPARRNERMKERLLPR